MAKIIVAGDSWACGEWPTWDPTQQARTMNDKLLHRGISHYLTKIGHDVIQLASGGHSNFDQLRGIQRWCLKNSKPDCILFMVTDPLRDFEHIPNSLAGFQKTQQALMIGLLDGLADLEIPVWLVGGCVPVDHVNITNPRIKVLCPDWVRMIVGHRSVDNLCRVWSHPTADLDLLEYLEQQEQRLAEWMQLCATPGTVEHEYFWPDGRHPNRKAHLWLFDHLRSQALPLFDPVKT